MKAAVWTDINKIEIKEVPTPTPKAGEVLVKVKAAGVCATDVHIIIGAFPHATPPHILGHEISGEVFALGENVTDAKVGDRVIINTVVSCGKCVWCKSGRNEMCPHGSEIGYNPHNGGYAEYVVVPESCLVKIPDSISFKEGAIMESAVCPSGSILRFGIEMGSTVFIQGGGPAGIAYIQLAKACGAAKVIASVKGQERIDYAKKFGADVVIDASNEDVYARVMDETDGLGARYSIDAAGTPSSVDISVKACANGGDIFFYGIPGKDDEIPFPVTEIVLKHLNIHGVCGNYLTWEPFVNLVASEKFNIRDMVTHEFALEDLPKAVELIKNRNKDLIKAVIVMD
ncbi:MAG: alcohol dehydrogenase catalytic domain-containing protein [Clostridia bacterium]|nr:alcohol dehydrogenase catalytic domain-containing protein [Clostridia bacterium]